jgi:phytoene dehydrogenase-like protein
VISTADPKRTLLDMVDPAWLDPEFLLAVKNIKMRGCTSYVFYAIDRELNDPASKFTATVSLTPNTTALEKAADAAKYGTTSQEPHVEFFAPTRRWSTLAPDGTHIIVARVQYTPHQLAHGAKWDDSSACALADKVTPMIGRVIPDFESSITHRAVLTPRDIEERYGVTEGALTQGEMTLDQILFMRPVPSWGRYRMPVDGLYLGGAGAHPGPGILGGAGYLAAKTAVRGA